MLTTLLQSAASTPIAVGAYRLTQPTTPVGPGTYTTPSGLTTAATGSSFLVVISTLEYQYKPVLQYDSFSNSYTQLGTDYHNGLWINAYLSTTHVGGANHTVTIDTPNFGASTVSIHFFEITGGALSSLVDVQLISYYNGLPLVGPITTTNANDLLISVCQATGPTYSIAGSGWSLFSGYSPSTDRSAAAYKNRTSTGTDDPVWSTTAGIAAAGLATIAFKQAAAAPVGAALAATFTAQASVATTLGTGIKLAASAQAVAAVSPALTTSIKLAATFASTASVTATLPSGGIAAALAATLTSSASVSASLGYLVPSIGNITSLLVDLSTPSVGQWLVPVPAGQTYADTVVLAAVGVVGVGFTWPPGFNEIGRYETDFYAKIRFATKQGNPEDTGYYRGEKAQSTYSSLMLVAAIIKNARKTPTVIVNTYGEITAPENPDVTSIALVTGPYSANAPWELPVAFHVMGSFDQLGAAPTITSSLFGSRAAYIVQHYAALYYPDQALAIDYAAPLTGGQSDTAVGTMESGYGTTGLGLRTVYLAFESSSKASLWLDIGVRPAVTASLTTAARFKADFVSPPDYIDPETGAVSQYNNPALLADLTTGIRLATSLASSSAITATLSGGTGSAALASSLSSIASLSAQLTNAIRLSGSAAAQSGFTATLSTGIKLAAAASGQAGVTAVLATGIPLSFSAVSVASQTAQLSTSIQFACAPAAQATFSATLSTAIRLSASPASSASITASMAPPLPLASDPRYLAQALQRKLTATAAARTANTISATARDYEVHI